MFNAVRIFKLNKCNFTKISSNFFVTKSSLNIQYKLLNAPNFKNELSNKSFLNFNINFSTSANIFSAQNKFQQKNYYQKPDQSSKNAFWYILSSFVIMIGASYAAVPLFKLFCESTGVDVNTQFRDLDIEKLKDKLISMKKVENRSINVKFVASTSSDLLWKFEPCQDEITVAPGETALAFFRAKNLTDRSIIGIATYTILPYDAGLYFNKIQCFCFEEQRLDPHEEVDMPVFFYIDEQFSEDPKLENVDQICLSYTFFESKDSNDIQNIQKLIQQQSQK